MSPFKIDEDNKQDHSTASVTFSFRHLLLSDVNEMTISSEFLEPGTDYPWEVLAIEESGNQSLNSSQFSTSS